MSLPSAFNREYDRWRAGYQAAIRRTEEKGGDLFDLKPSFLEFQRLYERWHPRLLRNPKMLRPLENLHAKFSRTLDEAWTRNLHRVVHGFLRLRAAERCVDSLLGMIEEMQEAGPEELPGLLREQREALGEDFDAPKALAEAGEDAYEGEQISASRLSTLAAAWPERVNATLRARLDGLDFETAGQWFQELGAQVDAMEPTPPEPAAEPCAPAPVG